MTHSLYHLVYLNPGLDSAVTSGTAWQPLGLCSPRIRSGTWCGQAEFFASWLSSQYIQERSRSLSLKTLRRRSGDSKGKESVEDAGYSGLGDWGEAIACLRGISPPLSNALRPGAGGLLALSFLLIFNPSPITSCKWVIYFQGPLGMRWRCRWHQLSHG